MAVALCTFTPEGGSALNIGTEDCWVDSMPVDGGVEYTVHSNYVNRDGSKFFVEGDSRASAESYIAELVESMGGLTSFRRVPTPEGTVLIPNMPKTLVGDIINPFTGLSVEGAYLTRVSHDDRGGRYYGFELMFTKPKLTPADVSANSLVKYKGVELGNLPGHWNERPDANFLTIDVTCSYFGDNVKYLSELADEIGFEPLNTTPMQRGNPGNRGVCKGYKAEAGSLEWGTATQEGVYIQSLSGRREVSGFIEISATFITPR